MSIKKFFCHKFISIFELFVKMANFRFQIKNKKNLKNLKMSLKNQCKNFGRYITLSMFFIIGAFTPFVSGLILKNSFEWKYNLTLKFRKPWFTNWITYIGMMTLSIPKIISCIKGKETGLNWQIFKDTAVPSIFALISSYMLNYSLIYMSLTVWQIFFSFEILFTTVFAVTIRKQQLYLVDWFGLLLTVVGVCFNGVAGLIRGISSTDNISTIFFMFILCILAHGIKSYETILEESLLHEQKLSGYDLTIAEGIWGFFLMTFIVLPICQALPSDLFLYENTIESFQQIGKSIHLLLFNVAYMILNTAFAFLGFQITDIYSAIQRNMYENIRPLALWILSTLVYYLWDQGEEEGVGEKVDKYSFLELAGYAVVILGNLIYNRVIRFPCFIYVKKETDNSKDETESSVPQFNLVDPDPLIH